ncbi:MAG: hypothetical protein Q9180_008875, partial [Flavoplaca navasiana]
HVQHEPDNDRGEIMSSPQASEKRFIVQRLGLVGEVAPPDDVRSATGGFMESPAPSFTSTATKAPGQEDRPSSEAQAPRLDSPALSVISNVNPDETRKHHASSGDFPVFCHQVSVDSPMMAYKVILAISGSKRPTDYASYQVSYVDMVPVDGSHYYFALIDKTGRHRVVDRFQEEGKDMEYRPYNGNKSKGFSRKPIAFPIEQFKYVPLEALQAAANARNQPTKPQLDYAPTQAGARAPSIAYGLVPDKNLQQAHKRPFKQVATASSESSLEHTIKRSRKNGSAGAGSADGTGLHFTPSATTNPYPLASNYSNDDEDDVE